MALPGVSEGSPRPQGLPFLEFCAPNLLWIGVMRCLAQIQGQVLCQSFSWLLVFSLGTLMVLEGEIFFFEVIICQYRFSVCFPVCGGVLQGLILCGPCAGVHSWGALQYRGPDSRPLLHPLAFTCVPLSLPLGSLGWVQSSIAAFWCQHS